MPPPPRGGKVNIAFLCPDAPSGCHVVAAPTARIVRRDWSSFRPRDASVGHGLQEIPSVSITDRPFGGAVPAAAPITSTAAVTLSISVAAPLEFVVIFMDSFGSDDMLAYTLLTLIVSFVLGIASNAAWLYLTAAAAAWLLLLSLIWLWQLATDRIGFFGTRQRP